MREQEAGVAVGREGQDVRAAIAGADVDAGVLEQGADAFVGIVAHVGSEEVGVEMLLDGEVDHHVNRRGAACRRDFADGHADIFLVRFGLHEAQAQVRPEGVVDGGLGDQLLAGRGILEGSDDLVRRAEAHDAVPAGQADEEEARHSEAEADVDGAGLHLRPDAGAAGELFVDAAHDAVDGVDVVGVDEERREGGRNPVFQGDFSELVEAGDGEVRVVEFRDDLQDAAVFAEHAGEGFDFGGVRIAAGHGLEFFVHVHIAGGEADGAGVEAFTQNALHFGDLFRRGGALHGGFTHHPEADDRVADERGDVDGEALADARDVFGEGFPVPDDAFLEGFQRHLFDLVEHADQLGAILGAQRREGERAVAGHDGGDAVREGGLGIAIPEELRIKVRVRIDEAGRDDLAFGVDFLAALFRDPPDFRDAVSAERDVGVVGRHAGAIDHTAIPDHQIVHFKFLPNVLCSEFRHICRMKRRGRRGPVPSWRRSNRLPSRPRRTRARCGRRTRPT